MNTLDKLYEMQEEIALLQKELIEKEVDAILDIVLAGRSFSDAEYQRFKNQLFKIFLESVQNGLSLSEIREMCLNMNESFNAKDTDKLMLKGIIIGMKEMGARFVKVQNKALYFDIIKGGELDSKIELNIAKSMCNHQGYRLFVRRV